MLARFASAHLFLRFVLFVCGGVFLVLFVMGFIFDEDFFLAYLTPERSVTWWLGALGLVLAGARALVPDENQVFDPAHHMKKVTLHTHYFPDEWRGREDSLDTLSAFTQLFEYRVVGSHS